MEFSTNRDDCKEGFILEMQIDPEVIRRYRWNRRYRRFRAGIHIEPVHQVSERFWDRDNIQSIRCSKRGSSSSRETGSKQPIPEDTKGVSAGVLVDPERLPRCISREMGLPIL